MKFLDVKLKFKDSEIIDIRNLLNFFGKLDRRRLYEWQKKKYIKKIANNYYIFADAVINDAVLKIIANTIYQPSYIGLESALSYYGLIPEAVFQINSITAKKTKRFETDTAQFTYRNIHRRFFWGYNLKRETNHAFFISDLEKTILDYLYLNPHLNDTAALEELRINKKHFQSRVNRRRLKKYLNIFSNSRLNKSTAELMRVLNAEF